MIHSRYGKFDAWSGFRCMPRKMTGKAIKRLVALSDASTTPIVVLESTTHL
jgi:hypothetical protein